VRGNARNNSRTYNYPGIDFLVLARGQGHGASGKQTTGKEIYDASEWTCITSEIACRHRKLQVLVLRQLHSRPCRDLAYSGPDVRH
jgi:hypothetical protein